MAGIFKRYTNPRNRVILNDANTAFGCSITGNDDSGNGSRSNPFATLAKCMTITKTYNLFRGKSIENPSLSRETIGDDDSAELYGTGSSMSAFYYCLKIDTVSGFAYWGNFDRCIIKTYIGGSGSVSGSVHNIQNCFINTFSGAAYGDEAANKITNNTILALNHRFGNGQLLRTLLNSIIVNEIDFYTKGAYYAGMIPYLKYCLIRKATVWKFNNVNVNISYTAATGDVEADSAQWRIDVYNSLNTYYNTLSAGNPKTYLLSILQNWTQVLGSTNKIVDDINGIPIFNKYSDGQPVDYSLNLATGNVALYMSSNDSYVGCYKPNVNGINYSTIADVDSNGNDTANTPTLLVKGMNDVFYASADSIQYRNRIRTNVMTFPRGFSFAGIQSMLNSGLGGRYWWGKMQPFTSTSVPQESIEIIPYDDATTPSSFPRFSAKLNASTEMWYHLGGAKNGQPVLFDDLLSYFSITTDKNLTEYGAWAVTTADYETFLLSSLTNCVLRNIPIKFLKFELNLNYAD